MNATIVTRTPTSFTLRIEAPYHDPMLDFEETLPQRLNEAGVVATAEGLKPFDTDGSAITVAPVKLTTEGQVEKDYQTPYGVATVARHVYQSPQGGATYCPLDRDARIVATSTPRLAKILSHKYAEFSSPRVRVDLPEDHGRAVSRCLIRDVADAVAAAARAKGEGRSYAPPRFETPPATVAIRLDGAWTWMCEDGWREAMVGTLASDDRPGERQHAVSPAAPPEYGEAKSLARPEAEIGRARAEGPDAHHAGIADGAGGDREVLGRPPDVPVTDFWHAAAYPGKAAVVIHRGRPRTEEAWLEEACHRREHEPGGAEWVLKRLRRPARERPWARGHEEVQRAITDFTNPSGAGRMDHASRVAANEPIGSGVTEAACQVIVERRSCGSGTKWTGGGAAVVLSLRALSSTPERWGQFRSKVDRWGFPIAA